VLERYPKDVKLVIKHFPLNRHKFARKAAQAALAAASQEKFWEFHHKLFESYQSINDEKIQKIAGDLKLDMEKFNKDFKSKAVNDLISRDINNALQIGVRGTPAIYMNGKQIKNRGAQYFYKMIDAEIKKANQRSE
jgi:protein-disulfide isomerase